MSDPQLRPEILLTAYANGLFPMADDTGEIQWFSPDPRAIIELDELRVSRSLRQACSQRRFELTIDRDFAAVIDACAERTEGTWISPEVREAYCALHRLGYAHSVETLQGGTLVGGLYGVTVGGAFFGESMFHRVTDASKVALVELVRRLRDRGFVLLDVQFMTAHLRRLGAVDISREEYLKRLRGALDCKVSFGD